MLNIAKTGSEVLDDISSALPKNLLFWGVVGAAVASSSVLLIKPLRKSLLALLGFKAARKVARHSRTAKRTTSSAASHRRSTSRAHTMVRRSRLANAR